MRALILSLTFILAACAGTPDYSPTGTPLISDADYQTVIEKHSEHAEIFSGLYNIVNVRATLLRPEANSAIIQKNARMYQWDRNKYEEELSKSQQKLEKETEIFVSLFTPDKKHDDLHKNKTLWKVFLDINGKRYEGKAAKIKLLTTEIQAFYPEHNTFSTPYLISFGVPAKSLQGQTAKLVLTGPVTSVTLNFNP